MVTPGAGDFFDQSMRPQLLQGTAGPGTEFFRIPHAWKDNLPDIPVAEAVYQISAIHTIARELEMSGGNEHGLISGMASLRPGPVVSMESFYRRFFPIQQETSEIDNSRAEMTAIEGRGF